MLEPHVVARNKAVAGLERQPRASAGHIGIDDAHPPGRFGQRWLAAAADRDQAPAVPARRHEHASPLAVGAAASQHDAASCQMNLTADLVDARLEQHRAPESSLIGRQRRHVVERPLDRFRVVTLDRADDHLRRHKRRLDATTPVAGVRVVGHPIAPGADLVDEPSLGAGMHVPLREVGGWRQRRPRDEHHEHDITRTHDPPLGEVARCSR